MTTPSPTLTLTPTVKPPAKPSVFSGLLTEVKTLKANFVNDLEAIETKVQAALSSPTGQAVVGAAIAALETLPAGTKTVADLIPANVWDAILADLGTVGLSAFQQVLSKVAHTDPATPPATVPKS